MDAVVVVLVTRDGVVVMVRSVGDGVDVVVVTVVAGDGVVVVVMMVGEGVVVVVVVSPSFSPVSCFLPLPLACLVAGVSCPAELLLEAGVLAISVNRNEQEGDKNLVVTKL